MSLTLVLLVLAASTAIVYLGSTRLESCGQALASHYALPPAVQGALIAAVGSSFPELCTTVVSTWIHGEFDLGVATIIGSAVFNILVIPALAGLLAGPLRLGRELLYKDSLFYLTSIAVLLLTFCLALIHRPVGNGLQAELGRGLALLPLALYTLYLFVQYQEANEHRRTAPRERLASLGRTWATLLASLLLIVVGVEGLVRVAIVLGERFDVPSFLWGATVLAAATSLPDLLVSVRAARRGEDVVSLSNVLGSNVFDLLVAVPAGVLIAGSAIVDVAVATPLMGFLTLSTIWLFAAMRVGLELGRRECWSLLALYALFVAWLGCEVAGVLDLTSP